MAERQTFVIIGAGLTGARAALALRDEGFDGDVVVVGDEPVPPYDRVTLSKHYLYGQPGFHGLFLHDDAYYADRGIELVLGATAELIDPKRGDVKLTSGRRIRYDALLIATGSEANRWHGRGSDLAGVHYLRTLADADRLRAAFGEVAETGGSVAVIGTGWAGCEIAAAASEYGLPVDLIGRSTVPLQRQLGAEIGEYFRAVHENHGVTLHLGAEVAAVSGPGRVEDVILADGSVLAADIAVFAIGATPRTELARAAGIVIADPGAPGTDGNGGILADELFRTNLARIYAAGDVASVRNAALGRHSRPEHFSAALHQGPAAARAMLGVGAPYSQVPFFFTDQYDVWMEYTGEHVPGDELVIRRLPGDAFIAWWTREGRVVAGMNVNVKGVPEKITEIITAGRSVEAGALADPEVPLETFA